MTVGTNLAHLKQFISQIENVEIEQKALATDKTEIYKSAKDQGWDTKIMRQVVKLRKMDPADRAEQTQLLGIYLDAVGT